VRSEISRQARLGELRQGLQQALFRIAPRPHIGEGLGRPVKESIAVTFAPTISWPVPIS